MYVLLQKFRIFMKNITSQFLLKFFLIENNKMKILKNFKRICVVL